MDDRLLQPFLVECAEVVEHLRAAVAKIGPEPDPSDRLAEVARGLGDLRVGCGFVGLASLGAAVAAAEAAVATGRTDDVSSRLEELADLLDSLRSGETTRIAPDIEEANDATVEPEPDVVDVPEPQTYPLALYESPSAVVERVFAPDKTPHSDERVGVAENIGGLHVLVVDDSLFYRELLRASLTDCEHRVTAVETAAAAIEYFDGDEPVDVVVSELDLPDADGISLAGSLRNKPQTPPLVALVAGSRESERDRALAAGFDRFLLKYRTSELLTAIGELQDRRSTAAA